MKNKNLYLLVSTCLIIIIIFFIKNATPKLAIALQQPPPPTPRPICLPPFPPAAYGSNPYPTEVAPYFDQAGLNQLGNNGPQLPLMSNQPPYVPCVLLKAIGYVESEWKHFDAVYGNSGYTKIGGSCDYGLMQIVSGMDGRGNFDENRANEEIPYNIGTGARTLIKKWNALKLERGGFLGGSYIVGEGNPKIVEDWYYTIWAYNSWSWINNPNNNCAVVPWNINDCAGKRNGDRPPFDPSNSNHVKLWYPYQELVWGYAAHPPNSNGSPLWQAVDLTLPNPTDIGGSTKNKNPNKNLSRPLPSHTSCSIFYLPIIRKEPTPTPAPTSTPAPTPTSTPTPVPCIENQDLIVNGSLENTSEHYLWVQNNGSSLINTVNPYKGIYGIQMGGQNNTSREIYQVITLPNNVKHVTVKFNFQINTTEYIPRPYDYLYWDIKDETGKSLIETKYTFDQTVSYAIDTWITQYVPFMNIDRITEKQIRLSISDKTDKTNITSFFIDNIKFITTHCSK